MRNLAPITVDERPPTSRSAERADKPCRPVLTTRCPHPFVPKGLDGKATLLAARLDWLTIAFRVQIREPVRKALVQAHRAAKGAKLATAAAKLGRLLVEVRSPRRPGVYYASNAEFEEVTIWTDTDGCGGWNVVLSMRVQHLAQVTIECAIAQLREAANEIGDVLDERVRRADLAGDFVNWPIESGDADQLTGLAFRGRGKRWGDFVPAQSDIDQPANDDDPDALARAIRADLRGPVDDFDSRNEPPPESGEQPPSREYRNVRGRVNGWTICAGAPLMLRVYDKTEQLLMKRPETRAAEHARWRAKGWDGRTVTRIEFQIRSEVLHEMRTRATWAKALAIDEMDPDAVAKSIRAEPTARNPHLLASLLDPMWAYCTSRWVRLVDTTKDPRRTRCPDQAKWSALREVRFTHEPTHETAKRARLRTGASIGQVLGSLRSFLASRGRMYPIEIPSTDLVDETRARRIVTSYVMALFSTGAEEIARMVLSEAGKDHASDAATSLETDHNAAHARFYVAIRDERGRMLDPPPKVVPAFVEELRYEDAERDAILDDAATDPAA